MKATQNVSNLLHVYKGLHLYLFEKLKFIEIYKKEHSSQLQRKVKYTYKPLQNDIHKSTDIHIDESTHTN